MAINLLPEEIINQIAAGEVIENPSAVVKELVENSIDSGADLIEVEIEDSGFDRIVVKDNGCGISREDLLLAPRRHATSKIKSFNDLYNIKTMGFRGEALASIFSVAKSKIVSNDGSGDAFEISSSDTLNVKESACAQGTMIVVEDLFYNTPARKKYLKSKTAELKSIVDVMNRFCVFHNDVKFVLKHDSKVMINKPKFDEKEDNLVYNLGRDLRGKLIYFEDEISGIKVSGFLGKPSEVTYPYVKNQYIYVNERFVKSKVVRDAIYEGFGTNLMVGRHPVFVLFVNIDPEIVDVNVHPTKIEIRFENELEIFEFVKNSVKKVFEKSDTIKPFDSGLENRDENLENRDWGIEIKKTKDYPKVEKENSYFSSDSQKIFEVRDEALSYQKSSGIRDEGLGIRDEGLGIEKNKKEFGPLGKVLAEYRVVGLLNKTYVVLETSGEMFLLDFHAAAEKIKFEKLMDEYEKKNVAKQRLLSPIVLHLDKSEMLSFAENKELFFELGFACEVFGDSEVVVRQVPAGFSGEGLNPDLVKEVLYSVSHDKKFKGTKVERVEKLARMACRSSVKAGYEMTLPEIKILVEDLKFSKEPFNCPHGRPTMLRFSWEDLEKRFKRIV